MGTRPGLDPAKQLVLARVGLEEGERARAGGADPAQVDQGVDGQGLPARGAVAAWKAGLVLGDQGQCRLGRGADLGLDPAQERLFVGRATRHHRCVWRHIERRRIGNRGRRRDGDRSRGRRGRRRPATADHDREHTRPGDQQDEDQKPAGVARAPRTG